MGVIMAFAYLVSWCAWLRIVYGGPGLTPVQDFIEDIKWHRPGTWHRWGNVLRSRMVVRDAYGNPRPLRSVFMVKGREMSVLEIEREALWEEAALSHFGRPWRFWAMAVCLAAFAPMCLLLFLAVAFFLMLLDFLRLLAQELC